MQNVDAMGRSAAIKVIEQPSTSDPGGSQTARDTVAPGDSQIATADEATAAAATTASAEAEAKKPTSQWFDEKSAPPAKKAAWGTG